MTGKRKRYTAECKARVALEALRGELTVSQLATKHGVHQTLIGDWKRQALDGLVTVFSGKVEAKEDMGEEDVEKPFTSKREAFTADLLKLLQPLHLRRHQARIFIPPVVKCRLADARLRTPHGSLSLLPPAAEQSRSAPP